MTIERDETIRFHEQGTLTAVTRWVSLHDEGIAEWLKNARRAYQADRANVAEEHRAAVLLVRDAGQSDDARIGLLDVGGATLEDVTAWSTWQDPEASGRSSGVDEEETQGNGGKAYMFRLFAGPAQILGVRDQVLNAKGFEGPHDSVERGTPGFMPSVAEGREVPVSSVSSELERAISHYDLTVDLLPEAVRVAIEARQAFTLVEASGPSGLYRGRWDLDDLIARVLWHDQSTLAIEQVRLYVIHNGTPLNDGEPVKLPPIDPYPDAEVEGPFVYEIPEELDLPDGGSISTTDNGRRPSGRVILQTSRENMYNAWKRLKPRWKVSYRTQHQMIGSKPVSELVPTTPGSFFVYGSVELPALEPTYVDHGRRRPKEGPLVEAVDQFVAEKIRSLARQINERRRRVLDDRALDEVQEENQKLDHFKNRFLPGSGGGDGGPGSEGEGPGPQPPVDPPPPRPTPGEPDAIELLVPDGGLHVAREVDIILDQVLGARVVDADGHRISASLTWHASDPTVATIAGSRLRGRRAGKLDVFASVPLGRGTELRSADVSLTVWEIDHVLLTPRSIELPLATKQQITAEVTDPDGNRSTDVLLEWRHDADDPLLVRISPTGVVTGNRLGRTSITAGAGDPSTNGVWARIRSEVHVVPNDDERGRGGGFPRLLVTGKDVDPDTQQVREGDPDSPALWQETADYVNNVWWLNLQSPEAAYAFERRNEDPEVWRSFHAQIVMDMVVDVHMRAEFSGDENERPEYWASHRGAADQHRVRVVQQMWRDLESWVKVGGDLG